MAFVGPSGGGKTTLSSLIARFWDVNEGSIKIGGVDIRNLGVAALADIVSFVTQDNFLFSRSIMENIRLGRKDATDAEVLEAARLANEAGVSFAAEGSGFAVSQSIGAGEIVDKGTTVKVQFSP